MKPHSYSLTVLILPPSRMEEENQKGKKNKKMSKFKKGQVSKKIEKGNKEKK